MMEREYMSQAEMMRTLEALVAAVDGLKREINSLQEEIKDLSWRLPLISGATVTIGLLIASLLLTKPVP